MRPNIIRKTFQFTHPVRGATSFLSFFFEAFEVSIHAPREGCDLSGALWQSIFLVSIHAPREGCDNALAAIAPYMQRFNSRTP